MIQVFEHQSLKKDEDVFTDKHLQALEHFLGDNDERVFPYYSLIHNGVRFRQYVGVICVGDLVIEVLPKTDSVDEDKGKWQSRLLHMLSRVYKLEVRTPSNAPQDHQSNSPILDIFINRFLLEVDKLLNRGLVKCYHKEDGNRKALKGKLLIGKHVTTNFVHKERFYVRHTIYDQEHILNRILRQAVSIIPRVTKNPQLRSHACSTLFNFPELREVAITEDLFNGLQFDRKTEDYREAVKIAKLLLLHFRPKNTAGKYDILALMFDMNKLWEEYVYVILKKQFTKHVVRAQPRHSFWENKIIQPDIVIYEQSGENPLLIIDTKWKCPTDNKPSDADLKQMFVYHIYWHVSNTVLLYPDTGRQPFSGQFQKTKNLIDFSGLKCHMMYFPIFDI